MGYRSIVRFPPNGEKTATPTYRLHFVKISQALEIPHRRSIGYSDTCPTIDYSVSVRGFGSMCRINAY